MDGCPLGNEPPAGYPNQTIIAAVLNCTTGKVRTLMECVPVVHENIAGRLSLAVCGRYMLDLGGWRCNGSTRTRWDAQEFWRIRFRLIID